MPVPPMLRLNKLVRAPRPRVFEAWTDPAQVRCWWLPDPRMGEPHVEMDVRVGGGFRIAMTDIHGNPGQHVALGRYTDVSPYDRLAFDWEWEGVPDFGHGSRVTVEFYDARTDDGPATEVILTHDLLHTALERSEHTSGWSGALRALGYHARGVDPREAMLGTKC